MAIHPYKEKADAARAQDLRRLSIKFLITNGKTDDAKRLEILGSKGYPSTTEMPYFAKMFEGQSEMVDLENPMTPTITSGENGPILFIIAD